MAEKFDLKAIISAVDKMSPTLKGIQRSVKLTGKTFRDVGRESRNLMSGLGLPAGLALGAVAYGAVRATRALMGMAEEIKNASDRVGASTTGFQTLANMLGDVGGTSEDAEKAFQKFGKGVADAAAGADKSFAGLMKNMRISLRDSKGNLRQLEDIMPDLAEAFAANKDPALQTRMAMELFGKSGTKLIPILKKGKAAYLEWASEHKRLGTILDDSAVQDLEALDNSIGRIGTQIKVNFAQALAKLVPVIQPVITSMSEWIAANREWLQAEIVSTLKGVAQAIRDVDWKQVAADMKAAAVWVRDTIKALGGLKTVLIGIGVLFLAGPIASIFGIVGAVWRFVAGMVALAGGWSVVGAVVVRVMGIITGAIGRVFLLMLANPVGLVIAAIAGAAYLIYKNWDKLKLWFANFWDWFKIKATEIGDMLGKVFLPIAGAKWLSKKVIELATDRKESFQTPLAKSGALQIAGGRQQLTGDMTVRFENAPPGMRVNPGKTNQPGVSMNPDVGYRSLAMIGL